VTAAPIVGEVVEFVEMDLDAYRITRFENSRDGESVPNFTIYWAQASITAQGYDTSDILNPGGNDFYTKILLHMDGTDASTTFTDSNQGGSAHTWTAGGNAQIDTADKKFGSASGLFDGTGDYITTPAHADYALGADDFTIDCWFKCNVAGGTQRSIAGQGDSSGSAATKSFILFRTTGNVIRAHFSDGGATYAVNLTGTTQFTNAVNTGWHHLAIVRNGTSLKMYIDGVQEASTTISITVHTSTNDFRVGAQGEDTSVPWLGWIDEFRLSVGIARWTAAFTPPTRAYTLLTDNAFDFSIDRCLKFERTVNTSVPSYAAWTLFPATDDVSAIAWVRQGTSGASPGIVLRGDTTVGAGGSGYYCILSNLNSFVIKKRYAGTIFTLATLSFDYLLDENIWMRYDAINVSDVAGGVELRAKVWRGELSDEPALFQLEYTDSSSTITSAGYAGLYNTAAVNTYYCGMFRARSYFGATTETLRYAKSTSYLPIDFDAEPRITDIQYTPNMLSLGQDLGTRAKCVVKFSDSPGASYGEFYDVGTYWGKFRASKIFRRAQPFRLKHGYIGDEITDFITRYLYTDSFDGPDAKDDFSITAQDILKFADDDRAQAPLANSGFLLTNILAADLTMVITPTGIGDIEYDTQGYANIAGTEIVNFYRDPGIDAFTTLMLHCDGADTSTTFTDSSGNGHTTTANGNAQIDTAQFKFGTASALFDGTGDYLSSDGSAGFAFGTGDFQIDFWLRLNATGVARTLYDSRPSGVTGLYPTIKLSAGNVLVYHTNAADRITGTTTLTTATWYFVTLVRYSGVTRLFLNGAQEGSSYTDTNNYLNGTSRPTIGGDGNSAGANSLNGWMDEIRVVKGNANITNLVTTTFQVPGAAWSTTSGDRFNIIRAQFGSTAADHSSEDRVQQCLYINAQTPARAAYTLLTDYTAVPSSIIPISTWDTEVSTYLGLLYTRLIAQPTGVNELLKDLIQDAGLIIWWDNLNQLLQLQVLRAIATTTYTYDESNIIQGSIKIQEQPTKQVTESWTFYGTRNPCDPLDKQNNFRSGAVLTDLEAASFSGTAVILKRYALWIPAFGSNAAERANQLQVGRFVSPPRKVGFSIQRNSNVLVPAEGGGYQMSYHGSQDEMGNVITLPIQVTQVAPFADRYEITAEEMLFTEQSDTALTDRVITIDTPINNINLYDLHNTIFPVPTDSDVVYGVNLTVIINSGVVVGSANASSRAFDVQTSWPVGFPIAITIYGRIQGAGGAGNQSGHNDGYPGGTALYTRFPITLDDSAATAEVWAGGGGGGVGSTGGFFNVSIGGGGGAGTVGGDGGSGYYPASDGTADAGGAAGFTVGTEGVGGGPGLPGNAGHNGGGTSGAGGAAGYSIDGISYVTTVGSPNDRRGSTVN